MPLPPTTTNNTVNRIEMNKRWTKEGGSITYLEAPRVDWGLRKPYGHKLTEAKLSELIDELKDRAKNVLLQYGSVDSKRLIHGRKVSVWLLGFWPGACGDERGVTKEQWEYQCARVEEVLFATIPDAITYKEEWSSERKFQFRWHAYVMTDA